MAILLVSTYELGRQPIHLAAPAGALRRAGVDVRCLDLSVETLDPAILEDVSSVAFSVPMHTAMRLAISAASRIREVRPDLPIAFYGLYADVGREHTLGRCADVIFCGEYEPDLVAWAVSGSPSSRAVSVNLGRVPIGLPDRTGLPSLDRYARLEIGGEARIAGAVEATHGCRHRCRHCPIPAVYDGRLRVTGVDTVLADIDQLVAMGARHITFADADFLNAPPYSMTLLRQAHAAHPELTFDVTVKVEHILRHRDLWAEMKTLGVMFVVSAFESVDDETLAVLDKGHTVRDMREAASILRGVGVHLRPTWLPFLPWTTPSDILDLFRFLDDEQLGPATDPVQLSIRVLIPDGSLLVSHPAMAAHLQHFDPEALTWVWDFASPDAALLHKELDRIAAEASDCREEAATTLSAMREAVSAISGEELGPQPAFTGSVPGLSESWFCCAEPTAGQSTAIESIVMGRRRQ